MKFYKTTENLNSGDKVKLVRNAILKQKYSEKFIRGYDSFPIDIEELCAPIHIINSKINKGQYCILYENMVYSIGIVRNIERIMLSEFPNLI